jgi:hypothetical protein
MLGMSIRFVKSPEPQMAILISRFSAGVGHDGPDKNREI